MPYIPLTEKNKEEMLSSLGMRSTEELFSSIPAKARLKEKSNLPLPLSEIDIKKELGSLAKKNVTADDFLSFLGAGSYNHFIPSVVKHIISRSEFYTAYTPYQPEISQGMLQSIFEYQSLICNLTGMDIANASMYDGATALAEAASLAVNFTKKRKILISPAVHPHCRQVLQTYANGANWEIEELELDPEKGITKNFEITKEVAGVIIQQPNFFGCLENTLNLAEKIHAAGALYIVSADPISLGLLKPPGEYGADIVVGEGQSLGNPQSLGGPGLGIFAVKKDFMRLIPGRIVGETIDTEGKKGYVLTLQTREQHIRREKASSNICSNEALNALAACVYLTYVGPKGLQQIATTCLENSTYLKEKLEEKGFEIPFSAPTFKEFVVKTKESPSIINQRLLENKIIGGLDLEPYYPQLKNHMLFCTAEMLNKIEINKLVSFL